MERLKRAAIMFVTTAMMLAALIAWAGSYLSIKPAPTIALAHATQADLLEAFAYTRIGSFQRQT